MTKKHLVSGAIAVAILLGVVTYTSRASNESVLFTKTDQNGDGVLDKNEFMNYIKLIQREKQTKSDQKGVRICPRTGEVCEDNCSGDGNCCMEGGATSGCCKEGEGKAQGGCCKEGKEKAQGGCCKEGKEKAQGGCCKEGKEKAQGGCCKEGKEKAQGGCCKEGEGKAQGGCCKEGEGKAQAGCCKEGKEKAQGGCCKEGEGKAQAGCCKEGKEKAQGGCCKENKLRNNETKTENDAVSSVDSDQAPLSNESQSVNENSAPITE